MAGRRGRAWTSLPFVSQFAAKNLAAIRAALDHHNASCPVPASAILLNPVDHELLGFDELWGLPLLPDERVPTKRVRVQCDGSAFGVEDAVEEFAVRSRPVEAPIVSPVGPAEDDERVSDDDRPDRLSF